MVKEREDADEFLEFTNELKNDYCIKAGKITDICEWSKGWITM